MRAGRLAAAGLKSLFGIDRPRLAVAALNPHAGEQGSMGDEEGRLIAPAVEALKRDGIDARGPAPADTLFHAAARATYDAALCMYHDQALIPIKTVDFAGGVNVTLGLPFVRTSPDHGTALDIAGTGRADPTSLDRRAAHGGRHGPPAADLNVGPEMDDLARLPPLRETIAAHGLDARKRLGQHFLLDLNLTRRIARAAAPLDRGDGDRGRSRPRRIDARPAPGGRRARGGRRSSTAEPSPPCRSLWTPPAAACRSSRPTLSRSI